MCRISVLAVVLLVGCGGPLATRSSECLSFGWDFEPTDADVALLDMSARVARERFAAAGIVSAGAYCAAFAAVTVQIHESHSWILEGGKVMGATRGRSVELGRGLDALFHELLHVVDNAAGRNRASVEHTGWDSNGFWEAEMGFRFKQFTERQTHEL